MHFKKGDKNYCGFAFCQNAEKDFGKKNEIKLCVALQAL
jgi:hypothetical protein